MLNVLISSVYDDTSYKGRAVAAVAPLPLEESVDVMAALAGAGA